VQEPKLYPAQEELLRRAAEQGRQLGKSVVSGFRYGTLRSIEVAEVSPNGEPVEWKELRGVNADHIHLADDTRFEDKAEEFSAAKFYEAVKTFVMQAEEIARVFSNLSTAAHNSAWLPGSEQPARPSKRTQVAKARAKKKARAKMAKQSKRANRK
jgi:hypothetical protein